MRNCWLLSRALKNSINNMMEFFFKGRAFDYMSEITDTYNREKQLVFYEVVKKYGPVNVHVDIIVTQENDGKYYVQELKIKRI